MWPANITLCVLLVSSTVIRAELPPEILVDKHLIHAEQLHAAQDYAAAFEVMQEIIALQNEHNLTLPDDFYFKYARVALAADSNRIALDSVSMYLSATGKESEFYQEALKVMLKAEGKAVISAEDFYNDVIKAQGTCDGLPEGSKCWMALTNHPECFMWIVNLGRDESAIWAGKCTGNVATGKGTLTRKRIHKDETGKILGEHTIRATGHLKKGKKHGVWLQEFQPSNPNYDSETIKVERHFVEGKNTKAVYHYENGYSDEFEYADGKSHVKRISRNPDGRVIVVEDHVNGKRHGQSVWRFDDGTVKARATYLDGKMHGPSVSYFPNGTVRSEGSYVNFNKQGDWVERDSDGNVSEGEYVDDEKNGRWLIRHPNGHISYGEYSRGHKKGDLVRMGRKPMLAQIL